MEENIEQIASTFAIEGQIEKIEGIQSGLINRTYHIYTTIQEYLLQKVNTNIFLDMDGLMDNIVKVTDYLKKQKEVTLEIVPTKEGATHFGPYRMYNYIPHSFTYEKCDSLEAFELNGKCFGHFHKVLNDFHGELVETIPHFHDTKLRYKQFEEACQKDCVKRKASCLDAIDYLNFSSSILAYTMKNDAVCHNDTKLSNILFDSNTLEPICIIDLDTLMPGSIGIDYGDALRSGANTTKEDDPNLDQVDFDLGMFEAFTKGFLAGLEEVDGALLTELEQGLFMIIYEQALRFLTDYLNGDTYYAISYPTHNLVRAKNQIQLLKKAYEKQNQIHEILHR